MRILALILVFLAAPASAQEGRARGGLDLHTDHVSMAAGMRVVHAWARATTGRTAQVFAELENLSPDTIALIGGRSDLAGIVRVVGFRLIDGAERYEALAGIPMRAGGGLLLAPRVLALELDGVSAPLIEGESFEMEFLFDSGAVPVTVAVEAADALQHSHAGHLH